MKSSEVPRSLKISKDTGRVSVDPKTAAALLPSSSVRVCSSSRQEGAKSGEVTVPAATARPPRARSRSEYQGGRGSAPEAPKVGETASNSARPRHERYGCRLTSAIPRAAIDAIAPTSRSTFRLLARAIDATNREADTLRHALLAQWAEHAGARELVHRLQSLDRSDPDGALGVDARLMVWFSFADPSDDQLVAADDPVLSGLSDELRNRIAGIARSVQD
jgi:hypothetical protein